MKIPTFVDRAASYVHHIRTQMTRRSNAHLFEAMPAYLLKDIGWPASQSDCCTDRAR